MAIALVPYSGTCDGCGGTTDVRVLVAAPSTTVVPVGMALCAECRIRAEAILRAGRKNGDTTVRNWTQQPPKGD